MTPPLDILQYFDDLPIRGFKFLGNRGGFSGALIWRLQCPVHDFCLKAWPANDVSAERLGWIHELVEEARASGIDFLPKVIRTPAGESVVECNGWRWDVNTWKQGSADFHSRPTAERLQAACSSLAKLHRVWQANHGSVGPCPGVRRRLDALQQWQELLAGGWRPVVHRNDPISSAVLHASIWVLDRVAEAQRRLLPWRETPLPLHPCWCDPWHDNLLFTGDNLTGLIDYGSVKIDHAAVDLARMLGSLAGDDAEMWSIGLKAYESVRPLSKQDRDLLPILDYTGLVVAAVNWLRWLYHEGRMFPDRPAVGERLWEIVKRLAAIEKAANFTPTHPSVG
jgi:Ser/Thr protein kinase RdoA (MazF antagonist)